MRGKLYTMSRLCDVKGPLSDRCALAHTFADRHAKTAAHRARPTTAVPASSATTVVCLEAPERKRGTLCPYPCASISPKRYLQHRPDLYVLDDASAPHSLAPSPDGACTR